MVFESFDQLIERAKAGPRRRIAVARAENRGVLEALSSAFDLGLVEPVLFGDRERIRAEAAEVGAARAWTVEHVAGDDDAVARAAVAAVKSGEIELLMKGKVPTGTLFKAVLDRALGLPRDGILSHVAFVEAPFYHKLFAATDGALNLHPDLELKAAIARNAIAAFHALGCPRPKVALLSYVETASPKDPETTDCRILAERGAAGELGEAAVAGPLAMDLCLSREAAGLKGVSGEVPGDADILVAPDITVVNASVKALILAGSTAAGVLLGASAPIVALSRSDTPRERLCSIALACALLGAGRGRVSGSVTCQ
jgi:phosphotransacetylase